MFHLDDSCKLFYCSRAITSGHCVCGGEGENETPCLIDPTEDKDQLSNHNIIKIGISEYQVDGWRLNIIARAANAYVKFNENRISHAIHCIVNLEEDPQCKTNRPKYEDWHDIGILYLRKGVNFEDLNDYIIPLCLPAKDAKIPEESDITMVGYGLQYDEEPLDPNWDELNRNPDWTTCATNQYGVYWDTTSKRSKFAKCKVKFMKDNKWGCKKGLSPEVLPVGYEYEVCEKYWKKAREFISTQPDAIKTDFQNAMKIKVKSNCENWTPECIHLNLFKDHGWCEVDVVDGNIDDWGICDTSCANASVL